MVESSVLLQVLEAQQCWDLLGRIEHINCSLGSLELPVDHVGAVIAVISTLGHGLCIFVRGFCW